LTEQRAFWNAGDGCTRLDYTTGWLRSSATCVRS